jgi:uncharacterized protein YjcR
MERTTKNLGGAPYGNQNALKHGRCSNAVRKEASERHAFCRECWALIKKIQEK